MTAAAPADPAGGGAGPVRVRDAVPEDAVRIGAIRTATWRAAYRGLLPQDHLDELDPDADAASWRSRLPARPPHHVLVAERGGSVAGVVGFAACGPYPAPQAADGGSQGDGTAATDGRDSTEGALYALYVEPAAWGAGAGRALIEAVHARLAAGGARRAVLWVLEGNRRARTFYERHEWVADGEQTDVIGGATVVEVRYARQLP